MAGKDRLEKARTRFEDKLMVFRSMYGVPIKEIDNFITITAEYFDALSESAIKDVFAEEKGKTKLKGVVE